MPNEARLADAKRGGPIDESVLRRIRAETPGVETCTHLNSAGAALVPASVHRVVVEHLGRELTEGAYEAADNAAAALTSAYATVARLVEAEPHNIAFVQSATTAFAQALAALDLGPGDVILTSRADYVSNLVMYRSLVARRKVELVFADDLPHGGVDPEAVHELVLRRRPALVALTYIPTHEGLVQAAEHVGAICAWYDIPYLVDACQAVGQLPVSVRRLKCDFLAATSRKFLRGPRGVGFLYVSDRMLARGKHPLLVDLQGAALAEGDALELAPDARRFETWERSPALILGLAEAATYAMEIGLPAIEHRVCMLAGQLRAGLDRVGIRVLEHGPTRCGIVSMSVGNRGARDLVLHLRARKINTSAVTLVGADARGGSVLRLSPHYYNTTDEISSLIAEVKAYFRAGDSGPLRL